MEKRKKVRTVWITGMKGLTEREAAEMLIKDARRFLQLEMGLSEAKWDGSQSEDEDNQDVLTLNVPSKESCNLLIPNNSNIIGTKVTESTPKKSTVLHSDTNKESDNTSSSSVSIGLELSPISLDLGKLNENLHDKRMEKKKIEEIAKSHVKEKSHETKMCKEMRTLSEMYKIGGNSKFEGIQKFEDVQKFETVQKLDNVQSKKIKNIEESPNFVQIKNFDNIQSTNKNTEKLQKSLTEENNKSSSLFDSSSQSLFENSYEDGDQMNTCITSANLEDLEKSLGSLKTPENEEKIISIKNTTISSEDDFIPESQKEIEPLLSLKTFKSVRKRSRADDTFEKEQQKSTPLKRSKGTKKPLTMQKRSKELQILQPCNTEQEETSVDLTNLKIINICGNNQLFDCFSKELSEQYKISLSIACSKIHHELKATIGRSLKRENSIENSKPSEKFCHKDRKVHGISICWGSNTVYYISLENEAHVKNYLKINLLKDVLKKSFLNVKIFDSKEQIKVLKLCLGIDFCAEIEDPKVGDWIMQPEEKEKNLQAMALKYCPEAVSLAQLSGNCKGVGSVGLDLNSSIEPRIRSSVEALVCWHLVDGVKDLIEQNSKLITSYEIEMNTIICLAKMELNGIGVSLPKLQSLADLLKEQTQNLEKKAFQLAGKSFSFTSSNEVAKVLGMYKGEKGRCSTNKQVLEQIENPISDLVLQWRKLNSTLTKMVYPLLRLVQNNRIYGCSITHNSTGRISMHEPNLQNIPRDFEYVNPLSDDKTLVSCRMAFVATGSNVLLSADYCQLELRLMAHLSQDSLLCTIMKSGEDVFKSIAAKWNSIHEDEVTDGLRQRAKQICYGIIYGMGYKSLSEQMGINEDVAKEFMDSFHGKYKGIQRYIDETVKKCKESGFVETIGGRKRFLGHIHHQHAAVQKQAERQAVNTTVQGSAADIAKKAMVLIERNIEEKFRMSRKKPKLVLHLHDELLYEVPSKYLMVTAKILKKNMEQSVGLSVPFPVKLKTGPSWGEMKELSIL